MDDKSRLKIYEKNQYKLIKALVKKIKECKELEKSNIYLSNLTIYYSRFLTYEQIHAAQMLAEASARKEYE